MKFSERSSLMHFLPGFLGAITGTVLAGSLSNRGIIEPGARWTHPEVRVCWASSRDRISEGFHRDDEEEIRLVDFTTETRDRIRRTIEREYTPEKTGIHFTGWQDCSRDRAAVPIYCGSTEDQAPRASMGRGSHLKRRSHVLVFGRDDLPYVFLSLQENLSKLKDQILMDFVPLHEFGHLAGLRHEHLRQERVRDPNCDYVLGNLYDEALSTTSQVVGPYDPNSIMNYCWGGTLAKFGTDFYIHEKQASVKDKDEDDLLDALARPTGLRGPRMTPFKMTFLDPTLIEKYESVGGHKQLRIRIGLSKGDVETLRSVYLAR